MDTRVGVHLSLLRCRVPVRTTTGLLRCSPRRGLLRVTHRRTGVMLWCASGVTGVVHHMRLLCLLVRLMMMLRLMVVLRMADGGSVHVTGSAALT